MSKLITIFLLLFAFTVNSQYLINPPETKPTRIVLKDYGWFTISLGTTIMASSYYIHGKWGKDSDVSKPTQVAGVAFATTIGIGLHLISWKRIPVYNPKLRTSEL